MNSKWSNPMAEKETKDTKTTDTKIKDGKDQAAGKENEQEMPLLWR